MDKGNISLDQSDWLLVSTEPDAAKTPADLETTHLSWLRAVVPGTVAQTMQLAGLWHIDQSFDFDCSDWWYHCEFEQEFKTSDSKKFIQFDGLATLAEVWLNGESILQSDNMFLKHDVDVTNYLSTTNHLYICFRSLASAMKERRPRPKWKTKLVNNQQLRWFRTSLLGRIPGWTPPVSPVGPWRSVRMEEQINGSISDIQMRPYVQGNVGIVDFTCTVHSNNHMNAKATLSLGLNTVALELKEITDGLYQLKGKLQIPEAQLWWPHTHGKPVLHQCEIHITINGNKSSMICGQVGFRSVSVDQENNAFSLSVNGEFIFCRGACWTVNDIISLTGDRNNLRKGLSVARDAGMNMVRVGGTMIYEDENFYELCDELGILVWQDFMFANMDYPIEDDQFRASVETEVTQKIKYWQSHPCIAVYCGSSEIEQQAAMLGMPREIWRSTLFSQLIPNICSCLHPDIPYVPSSPCGGVLPFNLASGVSHYYGVGAYMRPVSEVRRTNVRFASECLGFSNIPEQETINHFMAGQLPVSHHPRWKSRVPRDSGSGWDFEDVRDHYLKELYSVDAVELRCFDMERYLELSRVTSGEIMGQVYSEWRSSYNECGGGLVWFFKDLWSGAGWGIFDSDWTPKACLYFLKRVWQSTNVVLTDEGLDGVHAHIINENSTPLEGVIKCQLIRNDRIIVAKAEQKLTISARSTQTFCIDGFLDGFYDTAYAYRFGPPQHDIAIVTLLNEQGNVISEAFHFSENRQPNLVSDAKVVINMTVLDDDQYQLSILSDVFLFAVHFDIKNYLPDDSYFHLAPGRLKVVTFTNSSATPRIFKGYIETLSLSEPLKISLKKTGS